MHRLKRFLKDILVLFPAVLTLLLLFLPNPILNPGGILALIPIFYFFIFNNKYMNFLLVVIFLMVLDYNQDTVFLWTFLFIFWCVILSFQKIIILKEQKLFASVFFFSFVMMGLGLQWLDMMFSAGLGWTDGALLLLKAIWFAGLSGALYIPSSYMFKRIMDDR